MKGMPNNLAGNRAAEPVAAIVSTLVGFICAENFLQLRAERLYGFAFCPSVVRKHNAVVVVENDEVTAG